MQRNKAHSHWTLNQQRHVLCQMTVGSSSGVKSKRLFLGMNTYCCSQYQTCLKKWWPRVNCCEILASEITYSFGPLSHFRQCLNMNLIFMLHWAKICIIYKYSWRVVSDYQPCHNGTCKMTQSLFQTQAIEWIFFIIFTWFAILTFTYENISNGTCWAVHLCSWRLVPVHVFSISQRLLSKIELLNNLVKKSTALS